LPRASGDHAGSEKRQDPESAKRQLAHIILLFICIAAELRSHTLALVRKPKLEFGTAEWLTREGSCAQTMPKQNEGF
jgi:hypothetical protein